MTGPVDFLRHILPPAGPYILMVARGKTKWHEFAATVEELWEKEQRHDANVRLAVYHACASFREARHDLKGTPRPQRHLGRTQRNVAELKALWMDLDGGPGKPYRSGEQAAEAVMGFCQSVGLPFPVLVSSGNGCHAYWVLEQSLPPTEWIRYAEGLKALALQHNVHQDPARTADCASVLRTPGTHNRKTETKTVRCGPLLGPYNITLFAKLLEQPVVKPATQTFGPLPAYLQDRRTPRISDRATVESYEEVYADAVAEQCGQVRALRDTRGHLSEPLWYAALGVLGFCVDGDAKGHAWSSGHPEYTFESTQEKLERSRELSGATRCTRFHAFNPVTCERCPLWGTIVSPISAARGVETVPPEQNGTHALPAALSAPQEHFIRFPDTDKSGAKKQTCRNARVAIGGLGIVCEHDTFHNKMLVGGHAIDQWAGELSDEATQMLRVVIERQFRFDPGLVNAHDAAIQECLQHPFDPVRDYLNGLVWDRAPRVANWLSVYLGAEDTRLNRAIGALTLMAAVRRVRQPGVKFDQIVVLESPEGRGKSSAIEILAGPENFSDQTILTLDDKGQQEAVQGVWLYEIADLSGMPKSDNEKVKAFASRRFDRARPAYGRARVDRPRRCVFFATTNEETYLKSQNGNRRFWTVRIGRVDLEKLGHDRDQLWAEASAMEATGFPLTLPEAFWGEATVAQEARQEQDPWEITLAAIKIKDRHPTPDGRGEEWRLSTKIILDSWLQVGPEKQNMGTLKRIAFTMRKLGWDGPSVMKIGEDSVRGYTKRL